MIVLTLKQVKNLIELFGEDEETEVCVAHFDAQTFTDDDGVEQIAPAGLYAYIYEYPEEGSTYLGEENG